jgi:predicted ArsR family transcriptional regulator
MQLLGGRSQARESLIEALEIKKNSSLAKGEFRSPLTEEERRIVEALESGVGYDDVRVASRANLSVSVTRNALDRLRDKGLVEVLLDRPNRPNRRYALSVSGAVEGFG